MNRGASENNTLWNSSDSLQVPPPRDIFTDGNWHSSDSKVLRVLLGAGVISVVISWEADKV